MWREAGDRTVDPAVIGCRALTSEAAATQLSESFQSLRHASFWQLSPPLAPRQETVKHKNNMTKHKPCLTAASETSHIRLAKLRCLAFVATTALISVRLSCAAPKIPQKKTKDEELQGAFASRAASVKRSVKMLPTVTVLLDMGGIFALKKEQRTTLKAFSVENVSLRS